MNWISQWFNNIGYEALREDDQSIKDVTIQQEAPIIFSEFKIGHVELLNRERVGYNHPSK